MDDLLTPRERFNMLLIDEKPDRCCVMPLVTSHAAAVTGMKLKRYYTSGAKMANAQIAAVEEYGHDAISIFSDVGIIAEAMGSEFQYPDNDLPVLQVPALSKSSIDDITIPDPEKDGRLPICLDAIQYAYKSIGDRLPILAYVPAPFTTGMMLCDRDRFATDLVEDPAHIRRIMDMSLKAATEFCSAIIDAGGLPMLVDPSASADIISPRVYREFAMFYERELIDSLHRYNLDVILHIGGNTTSILDTLPETGADLIGIDRVEMRAALDMLSKRARVIGNFSAADLLSGSPETISAGVKQMVLLAKSAAKGYIASTGCEVPVKAPKENVKAFVAAAKEAGWYWNQPDKSGAK